MMQFGIYVISLVSIWNLKFLGVDSCSFGPACTYPCHCEGGDSDCNEDGSCISGKCSTNLPPGFDWRGPGCQIGNVARGKRTNQSGVLLSRNSSLAVDGRRFEDYEGTNRERDNQCSHTSSVPAKWYVDLGSLHVIHNATVFNQDAAYTRLSDITVYVSNDTAILQESVCGYYNGTVPQAGNYTIVCNNVMIGQYVHISIKASSYMNLCEVVVEGYTYTKCNTGEFGVICTEKCYCANSENCDGITGKCPNGCQKWYIGDSCQTRLEEPGIPEPLESPSQSSKSITIKGKHNNISDGDEGYYKYDVVYNINNQTSVGLNKLPHIKGQKYQTATVTGLQADTVYEFWIRPYREGWNDSDPGWDSDVSLFKTNDEPTTTSSTSTTHGTKSTATIEDTGGGSKGIILIAAGAGGGFILLIIILVIIVVVIKRRDKSVTQENEYAEVSNNVSNGTDIHSNLNKTTLVPQSTSSQATEAQYANIDIQENDAKNKEKELENCDDEDLDPPDGAVLAEVQKKPKKTECLKVSELEGYIEAKLNEEDGFKNEFETVPFGPTKSWDIGIIEQNKKKNKYLNIRAYDHTRVILEKDEGDEFSDYINANYITGYNNIDKAYIASQGPKQRTVKDFWKMIWQVKANRIIMVANVLEEAKVKCAQYWPETVGQTMKVGVFTVKSTSAEKVANFTTSFLSVKRGKEIFLVKHFHFTTWPDHGVPDNSSSLLEFRHRIRTFDSEARGPLVIHCSAGVGRTGTFIAIDHAIDKAEMEGEVNILGCTRAMREERINMIQTEEQYIFVYKAVLEATECGDTTINSSRIEDVMKKLSTIDPALKITPMQQQFKVLEKYRPPVKSNNLAGIQPSNETKNRDLQIIPGNSLRPILGEPLSTVPGGTDYINAIYVDGYEKADAYIMTQMPLPHTIPDLWRLMFDHKLKTIVMLIDMDSNDESCQPYWPEDDTPLQYGPLQVELVNTEKDSSGNVTTRELKMSKEGAESMAVKQFHLCAWNSTTALPEVSSFLTIMDLVQSWRQQTKNKSIVIHCMNGSDRSGVYCVANYILEQLKINRDFNIYSAIKLMRVARPQIIISLEQYKFLHNFAVEYIQQNDAYANFKM